MSAEGPKALTYQPGEAKTVALGNNIVTFLASREDTAGVYSLTEFTILPPPIPSAPLHVHRDADEATYVLEGELQVTLGEQSMRAPKGSFFYVPKGMPHTIANTGPGAVKILVILTPPGYEGYWEEMAQHLACENAPDLAVVSSLREKYHLEMGR
jgi:quercetin dioxygenase-like cupin family protein